MKKFIFTSILFLLFLSTGFVVNASERPKGLDDKGPLTKVSFIHYKRNFAKPEGVGKTGSTTCYAFMGKGVYWKNSLPRTLHVNTDSFNGLSDTFVLDALNKSAETWDVVSSSDLYSNVVATSSANWDSDTPDFKSEVVKASYPDEGVIAVTNVWGYFGGPIQTREIVDFDILFNDSFDWGDASLDSSKMDLQNIATHELGHGYGLADIYTSSCLNVTMFGYSSEGDMEKRSLEQADIDGIRKLYN